MPMIYQEEVLPLFELCRKTDPPTSREAAVKLIESCRRPSQCERILERLRQGSVLNSELSRIALNYTARIGDLRAKGYQIDCVRMGDNGVCEYVLTEGL